jgi:cytochrome c oxidase cbb3-type subunit 3
MARIIKSPPPFNLTLSRAPDDYLHDIIYKGGEKMGRSPRMPPWGGDLSDAEIDSVVMYIKTLRQ